MGSHKTVLVYGVSPEQFQEECNEDCIAVVAACYCGHGNGKFLKDNASWRNVETSSDILVKSRFVTLFKGQKTVEGVDSQWLRSLVDELCKNVKPPTEVNEVKEDTVTVDIEESPQSELETRLEKLAGQLEQERKSSQMLQNQIWQLKLQHREEVDELTTKCEQLETKHAEKVKECKHLYEVRHSLQEKINQTAKIVVDKRCSDGNKDDSTEDNEAPKDGKTWQSKKDQSNI